MAATDTAPHTLGAQFQAKFDSNCPGCDQAIYEGDLMGYVDDLAQCDGCYNDADLVNRQDLRKMIDVQREEERAADPEGFARREAAVKKWTDAVKAKVAENPGKEWVPSPGATPGWVRNPDHEPPNEQEAPVAVATIEPTEVEPGIAALMAAGLLQGQDPGGSGVCHATVEAAGIVTEVAIPVPVDPPTKARAPRKSRAKVKPEVPSTDTVGDPGAAMASVDLPSVALRQVKDAAQERLAQLEANAAEWDPATIAAEAQAAALQAGLQSAVNSGAMTPEQATALGWVDPFPALPEGFDRAKLTEWPGATPAVIVDPGPVAPSAGLVLGALSAATTEAEEDAILTALDSLPAYVGGFDHDTAKREILGILQEAIDYHPRSLQKTIGPSEIGTECDHCLAAKLAGWEQVDRDAWLPTVGTAVHSWIESAFGRIHSGPGGTRRFLTERKVSVGEIDGVEITGSTDLCDVVLGCTWDWKIVGATTLKSAKTGPSRRYVVQQMLYGRGWNRLGVKVTRVGIAYLPRNAMSLNAGVWWSADYDEQVAVEALERASGFARNIKALATLGPAAVDAYVTGLPRWRSWREDGIASLFEGNRTDAQGGQIICMDCARYKDYPEDPAAALKQLDGLL